MGDDSESDILHWIINRFYDHGDLEGAHWAEGAKEARSLRLDRSENWTLLLIYIHASRLLLGAVLGILIGLSFHWIF